MIEGAAWNPPDPVDCPNCGRLTGVFIVYGMPDFDLVEASRNGEVELGGCVVHPDQPDYRCRACGHTWLLQEQR